MTARSRPRSRAPAPTWSRFLYGPVPPAEGYEVSEAFYRRAARRGLEARGRMALKLAEHVPDMLRYRRHARSADIVHWQWLTVQPLDVRLLLAPPLPTALRCAPMRISRIF